MSNHQWQLYRNSKLTLSILEQIQDLDGELPENLEVALNAVEGEREEIIESAICTLKNLDALAELHAAEIKRLGDRRRAIQSRYETLHEWLGTAISHEGWSRGVHSAKWAKCPPSVEIKDETALPIEFIEYTPRANKEKIKAELKAGVEVPGCRLIEDKKSLRIK